MPISSTFPKFCWNFVDPPKKLLTTMDFARRLNHLSISYFYIRQHQRQSGKCIQLKACPWFGIVDFVWPPAGILQITCFQKLNPWISLVSISIEHVILRLGTLGTTVFRRVAWNTQRGSCSLHIMKSALWKNSLLSPAHGN